MTNKWKIDTSNMNEVLIIREGDDKPILQMIYSEMDDHDLLNREDAIDIAQQIIDDWNFTCDELEND